MPNPVPPTIELSDKSEWTYVERGGDLPCWRYSVAENVRPSYYVNPFRRDMKALTSEDHIKIGRAMKKDVEPARTVFILQRKDGSLIANKHGQLEAFAEAETANDAYQRHPEGAGVSGQGGTVGTFILSDVEGEKEIGRALGGTEKVWMVTPDEYNTSPLYICATKEDAFAAIKAPYGAPYIVTWREPVGKDAAWSLTGDFQHVPDYCGDGPLTWDVDEWKVEVFSPPQDKE